MTMTLSGTDGLTFPDTSTQAKSAATGQTGSAPFYSARAWVNFNGTGTVAIRASGNVSSITDNGTGLYTVNFTSSMPDINYAVLGTLGGQEPPGGQGIRAPFTVNNTGSVQLSYANQNGDSAYISVAIFR